MQRSGRCEAEERRGRDCVSGYRFKPKDEELILDYLKRKVQRLRLPMEDIRCVKLYDYDPDVLAAKYAKVGDDEWYFFTQLKRKDPKGSRPSRLTPNGYWKAIGAPKDIFNTKDRSVGELIGQRRALDYYTGTPAAGTAKTDWIMQEFTLVGKQRTRRGPKHVRLSDWVLCKMYITGRARKPENMPVKKRTARFKEKSSLCAVSGGSAQIDDNFGTQESNHRIDAIPTDPGNQVNAIEETNENENLLADENENLLADVYHNLRLINYNENLRAIDCIDHIPTELGNQMNSIGGMNEWDAVPQWDQNGNFLADDVEEEYSRWINDFPADNPGTMDEILSWPMGNRCNGDGYGDIQVAEMNQGGIIPPNHHQTDADNPHTHPF